MSITESLIIYLTIGCGIGVSVLATDLARTTSMRLLAAASAIIFWPLYIPLLLSAREPMPPLTSSNIDDELTQLLSRVGSELDAALNCLPPTATSRTAREYATDLQATWQEQHQRIAEIDRLLSTLITQNSEASVLTSHDEHLTALETARSGNVERLQQIRQSKYDELLTSAATAREIVSRLHLFRFAGEAAVSSDEIAKQLNAAVRTAAKQFSQRTE